MFVFWTHQIRHGIFYFPVVSSWYAYCLCENAPSLKTTDLSSFSGSLFYGIPAERAVGSMRWIALLLLVCPSLLAVFSFNMGERVQLHRHREFDPSKETERHKIIGKSMHDREVLSFLGHIAYIFHSLARQ